MSHIILGLQYQRREKFPQLIVDGVTLDDPAREALRQELNRRYSEWLHHWPAQRETTLTWTCPQLLPAAKLALLVVPSDHERFKNLYLIGVERGTEPAETTRPWLSALLRDSASALEKMFATSPSAERRAVRFVLENLKEFLAAQGPGHAALLMILGAIYYRELELPPGDAPRRSLYPYTRAALQTKLGMLRGSPAVELPRPGSPLPADASRANCGYG